MATPGPSAASFPTPPAPPGGGVLGRYLGARFSTILGLYALNTAAAYQVYDQTSAYEALGLVGLFEAIPALMLALFGGVVADRFNRRNILLAGRVALTLAAGVLALVWLLPGASPGLRLGAVYGVVVVLGVLRGLIGPSEFALLNTLVPRSRLAKATTYNSTVRQVGILAGPAGAGFLIAHLGLPATYGITLGLFALGAAFTASLPRSTQPPVAVRPRQNVLRQMTEGVRFVFGHQVLVGAIGLDLVAVLFGTAVALLPAYAKDVLPGDAALNLGWLRAAPAVGSVAVSVVLARRAPLYRTGWLMIACVLGFGATWVAFAYTTHLGVALALLALGGALDMVSVVIRGTLLQLATPQSMMGRVTAVNTMFLTSSNELGAFEAGLLAGWLGLELSVAVGGTLTMAVAAAALVALPKLRRLNLRDLTEPLPAKP